MLSVEIYSQTKEATKVYSPPKAAIDREERDLSLKQALELAEIVNMDVLFSKERVREAAGIAKTARSELLPEINGLSSAIRQQRNSAAFGLTKELPFLVPESVGPYNFFDTKVRGQMPLLNLNAIQNWRAAKAGHKLSQEELSVTREEARTLIASLYFEALRNQEALKTAKTNIERSERILELAQDKKNAGTGTALDVMRAEVQLSSAREQLESIWTQVTRSLLELTNALGINFDKSLRLTDTLSFPSTSLVNLDYALMLAFKQRPDLIAQEQRELVALRQKGAAISSLLPVVEVFGDYGINGLQIDDSVEAWLIGVQVTLPFWDSFKRSGKIEETRSKVAQAHNRTLELKRNIETQLRISLEELYSTKRRVEIAQETKRLAEEELQLANDRYAVGVGTNIEVINAQARLAETEFRVIENLFSYNLARLSWFKAQGKVRSIIE